MKRLLPLLVPLALAGCAPPELMRQAGAGEAGQADAAAWPELAVTAELVAAGDRAMAGAEQRRREAEALRARAESLRRRAAAAAR